MREQPSGIEHDIGVALTSFYDADGFLGIQWDAYGEDKSGVQAAEVHWPGGTAFRPRDADVGADGQPIAGRGANIHLMQEGNTPHIKVLSDPRAVQKLPRLKKGGGLTFGDTGKATLPFASFDGDTGSYTIYVPYQDGSKAHAISVNVDNAGQEVVQIIHGSGANITLLADGTTNITSPNKTSSVTVSNSGLVLNGNTQVQGAVRCGNPSTAQPVALAAPLVLYLQGLVAAATTAFSSVPGGGGASSTFAAAMTALAPELTAATATLTSAA